MVYLKALGLWFIFLIVIFTMGALREKLLVPLIGELPAHQIGTVAACVAVFLITLVFTWRSGIGEGQALVIGPIWLALSLVFEFGFFHYVMKMPWEELLKDYNIFKGRLLILLWLTTLFGPYVSVKVFR
jgi:hypothetical protein